jgi:hypothetical protein
MNKKQWIALGVLIFVYGLGTFTYPCENIQDVSVLFVRGCMITAVVFFICGWLEKEEAK